MSGAPGGLNRSVIMARAQQWVDAQIPYCQCSGGPPTECCGVCPYCADYRCDCSGYVSFTWELGRGYTTSTLPEVSHQISKDELLPGDVLLNAADHGELRPCMIGCCRPARLPRSESATH